MRMPYRFVPAAAVLLLTAFTFQAGASASVRVSTASSRVAQPTALSCDLAALASAASAGTTIVSVRTVSTPVSYCDVRGFVSTTKLGPDQVNFELSLPSAFNGRYILNAQGGSAGFVPPPPASQLSAGYAIVGTDEGNQSGGLDYRFALNRAAALDWDYLGVHVVTVSTEQLTAAYYSHRHIYTYIAGCSV